MTLRVAGPPGRGPTCRAGTGAAWSAPGALKLPSLLFAARLYGLDDRKARHDTLGLDPRSKLDVQAFIEVSGQAFTQFRDG